MEPLGYIIIAGLIISLIAFSGALILFVNREKINKIIIYLVSLSAGALIGGAFLHLLPEASELIDVESVYTITLFSIIGFLLVEKIFHWRHCHKTECEVHTFGHMSLFGDAFHNFLDGLVIAGAFLTDIGLGITTTLAVAIHEIPQEIGDFGVLLHSGFKPKRALFLNFMVALTVLVGGIVGFIISSKMEMLSSYILPVAAGGFIYIATSDLLPEIRKEKSFGKSAISFMIFILGIALMALLKFIGE